ncbi:hypothetical protein HYT52_00225 [Candidatus Woesearchaeota archaeon]|nr:hypothetical protein [Candidatus Woesearchaeota archaeon]
MRIFTPTLTVEQLERAKGYVVPYIFTENYFHILKAKLNHKRLSINEQYYYNHAIKKKIEGMMKLFDLEKRMNISTRGLIKEGRIAAATSLIKKYSRKHKNMKILISGSFLYKEKYNDIDIFILSKYKKEDYKDGKVHINFLPADVENTLFFRSISAISVANFTFSEAAVKERFTLADILHLYEVVILLMMQNDEYTSELRELILRAEYTSHQIILDSRELKNFVDKVKISKKPIEYLNKYMVAKIINSSTPNTIKKVLNKFIEKNKMPEKGERMYPNWKIYNQTYQEAMKVVTS